MQLILVIVSTTGFLALAALLIARRVRFELKWRDGKILYLRSENEGQRAALAALGAAITENSYGAGINLEYHVRTIRQLARTLAHDGADILDRWPEIAWKLRAVDDYLVGIAVAATTRPKQEVVRGLDQVCPYEGTYGLLAGYIERADI